MKDDTPSLVPSQLRGARGLLNWSRSELAARAGVTERTVARIEDGSTKPESAAARALVEALKEGGVEFIPENGGGPGVRLAKRKRKKP